MYIYRADKHNGTNARFIVTGDDVFRDVIVFSPHRQQHGGPCVNNGGCEELCLAVSPSQRRLAFSLVVFSIFYYMATIVRAL